MIVEKSPYDMYDYPIVHPANPVAVGIPHEHHIQHDIVPTVIQVPPVKARGKKRMSTQKCCLLILGLVIVLVLIGVGMYYGFSEPSEESHPKSSKGDKDYCAENNGMCEGKCVNRMDGYECLCPLGEILSANKHSCKVVDACQDNPCIHGSCNDLTHGYTCVCSSGYGGKHCEFELCDTDSGYVYYKGNGHCYKYFTVFVNWFQAEDHCVQNGGHLLSVNTEDERNFIDSYMSSMPHELYDSYEELDIEFWIGLYMPRVSNPLTWYWTDGSKDRALRWQEDEPEGGDGERCARWDRGSDWDTSLYTRDFADAYPCDPHSYADNKENAPFMCEVPNGGNMRKHK